MAFPLALGALGGKLGDIGTNIAMLAGAGDEHGERRYKEALKILQALQTPDFDMRDISPAQLAIVGEYFPEAYEAVIAGKPVIPEGTAELEGRQIGAMDYLDRYRTEGLPLQERLATQEIHRAMGTESRRRQEDVLQTLAMQGRLGGGQEAAARAAGGQAAMELAGRLGSDLTSQAIQARLAAIMGGAEIAGQARAQTYNEQLGQAGAMNRFNEFVSQLGTGAAAAAAGSRERAQAANVGTAQRVGDFNRMNVEAAQRQNQFEGNRWLQQGYQNEYQKALAQAGALQQLGGVENQITDRNRMDIARLGTRGGELLGGLGGYAFGGGSTPQAPGIYGQAGGGGYPFMLQRFAGAAGGF